MKIGASLEYIRLHIVMVDICCDLKRVNGKVLKFHMNNPFYF